MRPDATSLAWVLLLLLLASVVAAAAPTLEAGLPLLRSFTPKQYGAATQNWAIVQDLRGLIYVGNNDGVLEFDGQRWRLIRVANRTAVRSLAVDARGRVYVGAVGEIGYLEPDASGQMRYVSLLDRVPPEARDFADVWTTLVTPEGVVFLTDKRLMRLQDRRFEHWFPRAGFFLAFHAGARVFVHDLGVGLMELVAEDLLPVPGGERFANEKIYAILPWLSATQGAQPSVLIGTRTQGFFTLDPNGLMAWPTEIDAEIKRDLLYSATRLSNGALALGTVLGGFYVTDAQGHLLGHLNKANGLPDDVVFALATDRESGLWIASGNGIARVEAGGPLSRFDERSGLAGEIYALHRHQGQLYVATAQGLFRMQPGPTARFERVAGIDGHTWVFLSVGEALLVGNNQGVYALAGGDARLVRAFDAAPSLHASKAQPGRVWSGLRSGVAALRRVAGSWTYDGVVTGIDDEVLSLSDDGAGGLWLGTRSTGIVRLHGLAASQSGNLAPTQVERFGIADGLPSLNGNAVSAIAGETRFATEAGIYRFDDARRRFEPDPRFARLLAQPRAVYALLDVPEQGVWLHAYDPDGDWRSTGLAAGQSDGSYRWDARPLSALNGVPVNAIHRDPDGVLWFGGAEGLFRYDPRIAKDYEQAFPALIRRVSVRDDSLRYGGSGEAAATLLDYADNALRFEFAAPSFDGLEALRFQVRLQGADSAWSDWSTENYKDYNNLFEGDYRFQVRAKNRYGTVSSEAVYGFRVLPPWYRTAWAGFAYLLIAALLLRFGLRRKLNRLRQEQARLEQVVADRTRSLAQRTTQLETLNAILRAINEEVDFDAVLNRVLEQTQQIMGAEKAAALVVDAAGERLRFHASRGWDQAKLREIDLPLALAEARYAEGTEQLAEDIFLVRNADTRAGAELLKHLQSPTSFMAVRVRLEQRVAGYFIFDHSDERAFEQPDAELLNALKALFVSAFLRARALLDLQARVSAEAASHAKTEFLANMSHEIRTPMNAVLGFAGLGMKLDLPPKPRDYFRKIVAAGQNLLSIINDVLDFSKIESGKLELESVPFRLDELLSQCVDLFALRAAEKDLELIVDPVIDLPTGVIGDPLRLGQVLVNLLSNALKFTERGHIRVQLERQAQEGNRLRLGIAVSDTGIGISAEQQARLFLAFSQADSSTTREYGGTGLGLIISQRLVQQMGGSIAVDSHPGRGSSFRFSLDLAVATELALPTRPSPDALCGLRVLLVDDSAPAREVLEAQLHVFGCVVRALDSGAAALACLREQKFDVLLLDRRMPEMDGIETLRQIQAQGLMPLSRVIVVTAFRFEEATKIAQQMGCNGLLIKPIHAALLLDTLLEVLGEHGRHPASETDSCSVPTVGMDARGRLRGAQVLLVDDNLINQQVASEILQSAGVVVELANNGLEAVHKVDHGHFHAVLMDIQMPEMDGYQATEKIREKTQHRDLPIIAMTAHAIGGYREECLAAGMNDYVTKPIEPETLYAALLNWVKLEPQPEDSIAPQRPPTPQAEGELLPEDLPGIDRPAALRRLGGNQRLLRQLLGTFEQEYGPGLQAVRRALQHGDWDTAGRLVHALKGASGNLSARELYPATIALEQGIRARDAAALQAPLERFSSAFERILETARSLRSDDADAPVATLATSSIAVLELGELQPLLAKLTEELRMHSADAEIPLAQLKTLLANHAAGAGLQKVEHALEAFDFASALDSLQRWREEIAAGGGANS